MNHLETDPAAQDLVASYLRRLHDAASRLPPERREDLVAEITEHIESAQADGARSVAALREVLDRLGSPGDIVAADIAVDPPPAVAAAPGGARFELAAVSLLVLAELLFWFPLFAVPLWLAGVVLVFFGRRWNTADRVLALVVLAPAMWLLLMFGAASVSGESCASVGPVTDSRGRPVENPAETVITCTGGAPGWVPWVAGAVLAAFVIAQVFVAVRLYRRAVAA